MTGHHTGQMATRPHLCVHIVPLFFKASVSFNQLFSIRRVHMKLHVSCLLTCQCFRWEIPHFERMCQCSHQQNGGEACSGCVCLFDWIPQKQYSHAVFAISVDTGVSVASTQSLCYLTSTNLFCCVCVSWVIHIRTNSLTNLTDIRQFILRCACSYLMK